VTIFLSLSVCLSVHSQAPRAINAVITIVYVQLRTSANNVALPALAAARRAAVRRPVAAPGDRRYPWIAPDPQQQTCWGMQRWIDVPDRQTDGRTPYRYIYPAAYYSSSVKNYGRLIG